MGLALGGILLVAPSGGAGVLNVSWTAPTENTDGSPVTDLASHRVYYGAIPTCPGPDFVEVVSPKTSPELNQIESLRLTGLTTGSLYYVFVTAVNASGNESPCSIGASAVARVEFSVSPTRIVSFGNVNIGSFANQVFTVQNTRGGTVSGSASTSVPFSIVSGSPFTLVGAGATQAVTLRFTPTASATANTTVNVTANGETISRSVTGTGTGLDIVPSRFLTGSGPGVTPATLNITVTASTSNTLSVEFTFTDWLIAAGMPVKAVDVTELRDATDFIRSVYGLATFAWTDPALIPARTPINAIHLVELRMALNEAYLAVGRTPPIYTDLSTAAGLIIKAIHMNELRAGLRALQ